MTATTRVVRRFTLGLLLSAGLVLGFAVSSAGATGEAPSWCNLSADQLGEDSKATCRSYGYSYDDHYEHYDNDGYDDDHYDEYAKHKAPSWCSLPSHKLSHDSMATCEKYGYHYDDYDHEAEKKKRHEAEERKKHEDRKRHEADERKKREDKKRHEAEEHKKRQDRKKHEEKKRHEAEERKKHEDRKRHEQADRKSHAPDWCGLPGWKLSYHSQVECEGYGYTYDDHDDYNPHAPEWCNLQPWELSYESLKTCVAMGFPYDYYLTYHYDDHGNRRYHH